MKRNNMILFFVILAAMALNAENYLNDPYAILNKNYWAIGGDKILSQQTVYSEGMVTVDSVTGIYKHIYTMPVYEREDIIIDSIQYSSGFNSKYEWYKTGNDKIIIDSDSSVLDYYRFNEAFNQYKYLVKGSPDFKLRFEGMVNIEGVQHYIVLISNSIDNGTDSLFIHSKSFYLTRHISNHGNHRMTGEFKDYLDIGGVKRPFNMVFESDEGRVIRISIEKYEIYQDGIDLSIYGPAE